jgi:hypothetical protein
MKMDHIDPFLFFFFFLNKSFHFLLSTPPILLIHPIFEKQTTVWFLRPTWFFSLCFGFLS